MKESRYNLWVDDDDHRHVYNSLSGVLVSMRREQWIAVELFLGGDDATAEASLLHELVQARALINDETDELSVLRERYHRSRYNPGTFALTVVTSLGCNFDCPYCFEAKHPSLLDEAVQDRLLSVVDAKLSTVQDFSVLWFGGEPLVGKTALLQLSDEFIARSASAGVAYEASIITNGYLLTEPTARDLRDRGVRSAEITLDGPPEIHDSRRPLVGGRGTFATILANVIAVADIIPLSIRVNLDERNASEYTRLLRILADNGLAGRVAVEAAHTVAISGNLLAPSASWDGCLSRPAFSELERQFQEEAVALGFTQEELPKPTGAPCTAVRDNELVVGSRGELYKCPQTVGDPREVIGNLLAWPDNGNRAMKWLTYDPFSDDECRRCPVLPMCMGGCAHHAMNGQAADVRCDTFRFNHVDRIRRQVAGREHRPVTVLGVPRVREGAI